MRNNMPEVATHLRDESRIYDAQKLSILATTMRRRKDR